MDLKQALSNLFQAIGQINTNRETHAVLQQSFELVQQAALKSLEKSDTDKK